MTSGVPVLVTGGAGFIGSHACKALAAEGFVPVTLDNLATGNRDAVRWGPFCEGDVRDRALVADVLRRHDVSIVMHFAASAYVGESVRNPALYYDNNVGGMIALLEACRSAGADKIVFSSSCATYGLPASLPVRESCPQAPISPYGRSKLICEQMLVDHARAYGLRYAILRYFNAAGADPDGELSERHDPETHLIPLALMAAAGRRERLEVFGDDYDTPDGTCIRDYIHVADLARGHLAAVRHFERGGDNLAVNLGGGRGHSILEVMKVIGEVTGRAVPFRIGPRQAGDPPALYADCTLARETLDFVPQRSDLRTIVADAAPSFGLEPVHVQRA